VRGVRVGLMGINRSRRTDWYQIRSYCICRGALKIIAEIEIQMLDAKKIMSTLEARRSTSSEGALG
jgi:hypothetical protein